MAHYNEAKFWLRVFDGVYAYNQALHEDVLERLSDSNDTDKMVCLEQLKSLLVLLKADSKEVDTIKRLQATTKDYASEWLDDNGDRIEQDSMRDMERHPKYHRVVRAMNKHGEEFRLRSYSGRGMFGRSSALALETSVEPYSRCGGALISMGFSVDNMGRDFVYYLG